MRNPKAFTPLWAIGEKEPGKPMKLCFAPERGFIEPRTNLDAEPVIGKIVAWAYTGKTSEEDQEIYNRLERGEYAKA